MFHLFYIVAPPLFPLC